tara:strand:- start:270 stop:677 length:408 start_codon:yes stop_codon:yes gene_type:complete
MATNRRSYPNNYFGWYNDDDKLAIVWRTFTNDDTTDNTTSRDAYDTYSDSTVSSGIRISYHGRYKTASNVEDDLKKDLGLDVGLHKSIVCYLKYRMYEDMGDVQKAQYYKGMFDKGVKQFPSRKSGVRFLSVPRM